MKQKGDDKKGTTMCIRLLLLIIMTTILDGKSIPNFNPRANEYGGVPSTSSTMNKSSGQNGTLLLIDWAEVYEAKRIASMIAVVGFVPCIVLVLLCNSIIPKDCCQEKS